MLAGPTGVFLRLALIATALITIIGCRDAGKIGAPMPPTPQELSCYDAWVKGQKPPGVIRRQALTLNREHPDHFIPWIILGSIEASEANYPDALRYLGAARRLLDVEPAFISPFGGNDVRWHFETLKRLASVYYAMDDSIRAIRIADIARVLHPDYPDILTARQRIIGHIKAGRIDEAEQLVETRKAEPNLGLAETLQRRMDGVRVLFAREPDGAAAYDQAAQIAADMLKTTATPPYDELAFLARRQGRYEEARQYMLKSTQQLRPSSASHPARDLADAEMARGDWASARASLREMWNTLGAKNANVRQELEADARLTAARFYLAAGQSVLAEALILRYVDHPVRAGFSTRSIDEWRAGVYLLAWSASRQIRALETAMAGHEAWYRRSLVWLRQWPRRWTEYRLASRIRGTILSRYSQSVQPRDFLVLLQAPEWIWGDVATILGPNAFRDLMSRYALAGAQQQLFESAFLADLHYQASRWDNAALHARQALDFLPQDESLLRARMFAMAGESVRRVGDANAAMQYFTQAVRINPAIFLMTGIRLPVSDITSLKAPGLLRRMAGGFDVDHRAEGDSLIINISINGEILHHVRTPYVGDDPAISARVIRSIFSPIGIPDPQLMAVIEGRSVNVK